MRSTTPQRPRRKGLGLLEAMIALAIASMLLTAIASAFVAASRAVTENDEFFRATSTGRVALTRMLTEIRRGSVDDGSTSGSLHLITDTGTDVRYSYDSGSRVLRMIIRSNGVDTTYSLARNVSACNFTYQTGNDYAGNPCIARVSISITVTVDNNQVLLSGGGTPRANIAF